MNKGLESLSKIIDWIKFKDKDLIVPITQQLKCVEKELKALEIIKDKDISPALVTDIKLDRISYEYYIENNNWLGRYGKRVLSKEDFDLVKEVLSNE